MGQWFWIGDVDEPSTTKEKKKKSSPKVEADSKKPVDSKKRSASKGEEKEKVIKKPRSVKEQPDQPIETRKRKTIHKIRLDHMLIFVKCHSSLLKSCCT